MDMNITESDPAKRRVALNHLASTLGGEDIVFLLRAHLDAHRVDCVVRELTVVHTQTHEQNIGVGPLKRGFGDEAKRQLREYLDAYKIQYDPDDNEYKLATLLGEESPYQTEILERDYKYELLATLASILEPDND